MIRVLAALLVLLALQFVPGVGVGDALATTFPTGCTGASVITCDTRADAWTACSARVAEVKPTSPSAVCYPSNANEATATAYLCGKTYFGQGCGGSGSSGYNWRATCQVGATWTVATHTCFDPAVCLAKPPLGQDGTFNLSVANSRCSAGCKFEYRGQTQQITMNDGTPIKVGSGGKFAPTGAACAAGDPAPATEDTTPPDQYCAPAPDGQTFCLAKDGRYCQSAGTGRQICWRPGETGEKTDGNILQKRAAGPTVGTPGTVAPQGAMFEPVAAGVKIMAEYGWFRDEGESSDGAITTTTQNYKATEGVNAGGSSPDQGQNSDGTSGTSTGNAGPGGSGTGTGSGDGTYPEGGSDGGTGAASSDTAFWHPQSTEGLLGMLDDTGFLTRTTCPPIPVMDFGFFGVYEPEIEGWCDLIAAWAALIMFAASVGAIVILMD